MAMNIYRLCGDALNVLGLIALLTRLMTSRNAQGISLRSLEIYLLVCVARYLDLFTTFYSRYNSLMKVFYLLVPLTAVLLFRHREAFTTSYDKSLDSFPHWRHAAAPSFLLAVVVHLTGSGIRGFDTLELLWTFSICLEPCVLIPQLYVLQEYEEVECLTGTYIFGKSIYRALYIMNWIYRAHTEPHYRHHYLVYLCGVIQSVIGGYAIIQLFNKSWNPMGLFSINTYTQPRLSRLQQQEETGVEQENKIELKQDRHAELQEPLLVV